MEIGRGFATSIKYLKSLKLYLFMQYIGYVRIPRWLGIIYFVVVFLGGILWLTIRIETKNPFMPFIRIIGFFMILATLALFFYVIKTEQFPCFSFFRIRFVPKEKYDFKK